MREKNQQDNAQENQEAAPVKDKQSFEKRRSALYVYVIVLFSVAFLLVLLSFFIQLRNSNETISQLRQSSASAMTNVENLQEANQILQSENSELSAQVASLEAQLAALQEDLEQTESNYTELSEENAALLAEKKELESQLTEEIERADQAETEIQTLTNTQRAYELLIQANNYYYTGYYDAATECLDNIENEGLPDLLGQQAAVLYNSLPSRIYIAQLPSTDSVE